MTGTRCHQTLPESSIIRWLSNFQQGIQILVGPIVGLTRKGCCALKHWICLWGISLIANWEWLQNLSLDWDGTLYIGVPITMSVKTMNGFQTVFVAVLLANSDYHGQELTISNERLLDQSVNTIWIWTRLVSFFWIKLFGHICAYFSFPLSQVKLDGVGPVENRPSTD